MVARRQWVGRALTASAGAAVSTAHPLGIIAATAMPTLALTQETRQDSYVAALSYYGAALWPLIPGARNFFGPHVSALVAVTLWVVSSMLLALPWILVWSPHQRQTLWRAPLGLALTVVPPLGIIGWASPLTAAGILFPGTAWFGLVLCALSTGALVQWPRRAAVVLTAASLTCNLITSHESRRLPEWKALNTTFGAIAHGSKNGMIEYQASEWIQQQALNADAKVIVFPETVVPTWTSATDAFWQQTLDRLRSSGKTVLVGARLPVPYAAARARYDFSADLAALSGTSPRIVPIIDSGGAPMAEPRFAYDNALVLRGAESGSFKQRIPVPIAMWNPLKRAAARLNLSGAGVVDLHGERAAVLICYEQLLTWPVLASMVKRPTVLIAVANDHWAAGTPIPCFQVAAVWAWARLFRLPCLSAVNT
jgi:hypothetical protein